MSKVASKAVLENKAGVEFAFNNGESVQVLMSDFDAEMINKLALHGLKQKLGDSYAGCKGDVAVAFESFNKTLENLKAGNFNVAREGGGAARVTLLAEAVANITQKPLDEVVAQLAEMDKDQKLAIGRVPQIKAEKDRISAERSAAKAADSDELDVASLFS